MHAYLGTAIPTLVVLHVLAVTMFFLFHGPSVFVMLALRSERRLEKVQALLDLSRNASGWSWTAWALLALTGTLLALAEHAWKAPWVWGSAVVLVLVSGVMSPLAARAFNHAREAAGLPWFDGKGMRDPIAVDEAGLVRALDVVRARSVPALAIGLAGALLLVWLMVAKPAL